METFSPFGRFRGPIIPTWILENNCLTPGAKLLYVVMAACTCGKDHCWPSQSILAEKMRVSLRTVKNYLDELVKQNLIRIDQAKTGTVLTYYFLKSEAVKLYPSASASAQSERSLPSQGYANFADPAAKPTGDYAKSVITREPARSASATAITPVASPPAMSFPFASAPSGGAAPFAGGYAKSAGGYANSAPNKYNINKNINTNPPLPPQVPETGQMALPSSPEPCGVEGGASALESCEKAFSRVFDAWPRKEAQTAAFRAWKGLWFSGRLPSVEELLLRIEFLKKHDRTWLRNFAPYLVNWLWDERWRDTGQSQPSLSGQSNSSPAASTPFDSAQAQSEWPPATIERYNHLFRQIFSSSHHISLSVEERQKSVQEFTAVYVGKWRQPSVSQSPRT
jgi:hypothetical protein